MIGSRMVAVALLVAGSAWAASNAESVAGDYERRDDGYDSEHEPATITVKALPNGRVAISGEALWIGDAERGQVNVGTLEGEFALESGVVHYSDGESDGCRITLRFRDDALDAEETGGYCGGMNVRFGGHYPKNG